MLPRRNRVPDVTIKRLALYLRVVRTMMEEGVECASSWDLAVRSGVSPEQLRKDLAYFGTYGTKGVGYHVRVLHDEVRAVLAVSNRPAALLVGAGNLGMAVARYLLDRDEDVRLAAIFDQEPDVIGRRVKHLEVLPMQQLKPTVAAHAIRLGIIAVPRDEAQVVASTLTDAGIDAMLNFAPTRLVVPSHCFVRNIDLITELMAMAFYVTGENGKASEVSGQ